MTEDPKRLFVALVGRLGRETQLHLDERQHHFRITNLILGGLSLVLLILAAFNIYFVHILYKDFNGIVSNMESMHYRLEVVRGKMESITDKVGMIDQHMVSMDHISAHTRRLGDAMPRIRVAMHQIGQEVGGIEQDMQQMSSGMSHVDQRLVQMTGGVGTMRENVRQLARPMGFMNPILP